MTTEKPKVSKLAFPNYKAVAKLKKLAENPVDLTNGILTPERIKKYKTQANVFTFLYGTEKINDEVMSALKELAQEANVIDWMKRMQNGEVINKIEGYPSDNRSVLHTAMRDFFDQPNQSKAAAEATKMESVELEKLKKFLKNNDTTNKYTDLVMIGIGGSDLGPKSLYYALQYLQKPNRKVHFISNIDPNAAGKVLREIDLNHTLVAAVSKSGSTMETVSNEELMREQFVKAGLDPNDHFIAITGKGSPLDDPKKFVERFISWDFVGGRFCSTAIYGAVLLSFAYGFDNFWKLLEGAHAMDKIALNPNVDQNLPLLIALLGVWNNNFLNYPTKAIISYSQPLEYFVSHIQQLDMESNGKRIDRHGVAVDFNTCPIIWGQTGTVAQHSFFQMLHQGTEIVPMEFIGFKNEQYDVDYVYKSTTNQEKLISNMLAQSLALAQGQKSDNPNKVFPGNRPSHIIFADRLDPYTMGALFALQEHVVVFQGFIWDINSFDQEGVQLGKVLAEKVLSLFAAHNDKKGQVSYPLGQTLIETLNLFKD